MQFYLILLATIKKKAYICNILWHKKYLTMT